MKYALASLPGPPDGGVTAGMGWASEDQAVCIVGTAGEVIGRFSVAHSAGGLDDLVRRLARASAGEVAIERGDGRLWMPGWGRA
jgi:transposase